MEKVNENDFNCESNFYDEELDIYASQIKNALKNNNNDQFNENEDQFNKELEEENQRFIEENEKFLEGLKMKRLNLSNGPQVTDSKFINNHIDQSMLSEVVKNNKFDGGMFISQSNEFKKQFDLVKDTKKIDKREIDRNVEIDFNNKTNPKNPTNIDQFQNDSNYHYENKINNDNLSNFIEATSILDNNKNSIKVNPLFNIDDSQNYRYGEVNNSKMDNSKISNLQDVLKEKMKMMKESQLKEKESKEFKKLEIVKNYSGYTDTITKISNEKPSSKANLLAAFENQTKIQTIKLDNNINIKKVEVSPPKKQENFLNLDPHNQEQIKFALNHNNTDTKNLSMKVELLETPKQTDTSLRKLIEDNGGLTSNSINQSNLIKSVNDNGTSISVAKDINKSLISDNNNYNLNETSQSKSKVTLSKYSLVKTDTRPKSNEKIPIKEKVQNTINNSIFKNEESNLNSLIEYKNYQETSLISDNKSNNKNQAKYDDQDQTIDLNTQENLNKKEISTTFVLNSKPNQIKKLNQMTMNEAKAYEEIMKNNMLIKESNNEWEKKTLIEQNRELEKQISPYYLYTIQNKFNLDK